MRLSSCVDTAQSQDPNGRGLQMCTGAILGVARVMAISTIAIWCAGCTLPSSILGAGTASTTPGGQPPGSSLQALTTALAMQSGEERPLITLLRSSNGQLPTQDLIWTSSDDSIARVNPTTGQLKAVAPGSVVVVASLRNDPSVKVALSVTVAPSQSVLLIKLAPDTPTMQVGETTVLKAEVDLADGTINSNVTWASSDNTIATVNPTTGEISALREGKVTIAGAYALDSKFKGLAVVTVVKDKTGLTPTAAPSSIIFGPGATPMPVVSPPHQDGMAVTSPQPLATSSSGPVVRGTGLVVSGFKFIPYLVGPSAEPQDNGDKMLQRGETVFLLPIVTNESENTSDHITVALSTTDENVSIIFHQTAENRYKPSIYIDTAYSHSPVRAGYVVEIGDENKLAPTEGVQAGYLISVSKTCPSGHVIPVTATMSDRYGNSWASQFSITIP